MINKESILKIIKYLFSSGTSFILDLLIFSIANHFIKNIMISTIIARVCSSLYNYLINSRIVFKNYTKTSIIKYYILVIVQMFVSGLSTSLIADYFNGTNATIIKFFVDIIIFVINYFVQKEVVFK